MSIPNALTCGDYTNQEFQTGNMICASSDAATRKKLQILFLSEQFLLICLSTADAGAPCQYDEGSPMIQTMDGRPTAVGIMSKNKGGSVDLPSVYTRLSVYYAWFLQTAGQQPVDETTVPTSEPQTTDPITTEGVVVTTEEIVVTTELVTQEITTIVEDIVTDEVTVPAPFLK
jgi:secreted trypsin-like serine protease